MIVINSSTRQFNVPGADLTFGVEADSGSEIKYFQCPRYVGNNLDIAGCFVRINYRNANGEIDSYLVNDVAVDGDNVTFSWVLSPKVTDYKGQIRFVMCVVGPDTKVKWHTTLGMGQVLEGLEPDVAVESETADVVAQLIAMVEQQTTAVENVGAEWVRNVQSEGTDQVIAVQTAARDAQSDAVAQIEAKGASTLATIPVEYTTTVSAVQSAANAIRKKVSGEVIRVDDVSPMEHYPVVKVQSKNLFDIDSVLNEQFVKNEDGTYTIRKYNGLRFSEFANVYIPAGTTITAKVHGLHEDGFTNFYFQLWSSSDETKGISFSADNLDKTTSWEKDTTRVRIYMPPGAEEGDYKTFSGIQLELGEVATDYTPYIDPTTVTVTRCGKNVLEPSGSKSQNGVTLTMDENGVYTISGTTTASINLNLGNMILKAGCKYKPTIHLYSGSIKPSFWSFAAQANMYTDKDGCLVSEADTKASSFIYASSAGSTYDAKFTIMVELVNDENTGDYELYDGEEQIPTVDGTVSGLRSVSPTMTLLTDTAGVNIECEYSRDTNKVIAEILEKITALGG